jgi:hypothetical protein
MLAAWQASRLGEDESRGGTDERAALPAPTPRLSACDVLHDARRPWPRPRRPQPYDLGIRKRRPAASVSELRRWRAELDRLIEAERAGEAGGERARDRRLGRARPPPHGVAATVVVVLLIAAVLVVLARIGMWQQAFVPARVRRSSAGSPRRCPPTARAGPTAGAAGDRERRRGRTPGRACRAQARPRARAA